MVLESAVNAAIHTAAFCSALQLAGYSLACSACEALSSTTEGLGKGASRCLRSALGLQAEEGDDAAAQHTSALAYAHTAVARFCHTAAVAFHDRSYLTATALLDVTALWAVWRTHKEAHAEAAAAAAVRRAAEDPANRHAQRAALAAQELPLLQCAAAHSKAAYGAPAAAGLVSSASGYLQLITVGQVTGKAPRHVAPAQHLAAVQQLTGVPPGDVVAAQWQAHLHRPAWYVAIDRRHRHVVVCVRGTIQLGDFATVLDAVPQPITLCGWSGHVHGGFLAAARNLLPHVAAALRTAARDCPGWPLLVTGHSLGGGVAAVLATLLLDLRQRAQQAAELGQPLAAEEARQLEALQRLGEMRCIGIGAAAAFCRELGMACRPHVTSVLYGADCLPMFSVLGARLLIEEVHAKSQAAALVQGLLRRVRRRPGHSRCASLDGSDDSPTAVVHRRSASAASASSFGSAVEGCEIEEAGGGCGGGGGSRLRRCSSAWSSASTATIAAFAADPPAGGAGAALVPMAPPGRILWMLPDERDPAAQPQLVETDQSAFQRFLVTLDTTTHHLPDVYEAALASLAG